jgi:hypothetical protein
MLDFFADLLLITGGLICVMVWLVLIGAIAIEVNDFRRERREVLEEGGAEGSNPQ